MDVTGTKYPPSYFAKQKCNKTEGLRKSNRVGKSQNWLRKLNLSTINIRLRNFKFQNFDAQIQIHNHGLGTSNFKFGAQVLPHL